jgi:hypothetical protein
MFKTFLSRATRAYYQNHVDCFNYWFHCLAEKTFLLIICGHSACFPQAEISAPCLAHLLLQAVPGRGPEDGGVPEDDGERVGGLCTGPGHEAGDCPGLAPTGPSTPR